MVGVLMKLSLKDLGAGKAVKQLAENISRPQKMLSKMGMVMISSIQQNFIAQGRPVPWERSQRAIDEHGKTLRDTGRLMNSITMKVYENHVKVGTNVIYAAIHHFGGTISKDVLVKAHVRYYKNIKSSLTTRNPTLSTVVKEHGMKMNLTIPKRPFMLLQDSDWEIIKQIGYDHLIPIQGTPI